MLINAPWTGFLSFFISLLITPPRSFYKLTSKIKVLVVKSLSQDLFLVQSDIRQHSTAKHGQITQELSKIGRSPCSTSQLLSCASVYCDFSSQTLFRNHLAHSSTLTSHGRRSSVAETWHFCLVTVLWAESFMLLKKWCKCNTPTSPQPTIHSLGKIVQASVLKGTWTT